MATPAQVMRVTEQQFLEHADRILESLKTAQPGYIPVDGQKVEDVVDDLADIADEYEEIEQEDVSDAR